MLTRSLACEHPVVGRAEPLDLAPFLGEGLDDADAGNGVGQHAGHLAQAPAAQVQTRAAAGCARDAPARRSSATGRAWPRPARDRCDNSMAAVSTIISTSLAKSSTLTDRK